jgi:hypothetical protein
MRRLAPWGLLQISDDDDEFATRYRERLDAIGARAVRKHFHLISAEHDGRGLVLLGYEPPGQFCHRRVFADF